MPAMKITRGMGDRLKQTTAGSGGLQFGGVWTVVIVAQVAATVMFPAVVYIGSRSHRERHRRTSRPDSRPSNTSPCKSNGITRLGANTRRRRRLERNARLPATLEELRRQVASQPGVSRA